VVAAGTLNQTRSDERRASCSMPASAPDAFAVSAASHSRSALLRVRGQRYFGFAVSLLFPFVVSEVEPRAARARRHQRLLFSVRGEPFDFAQDRLRRT